MRYRLSFIITILAGALVAAVPAPGMSPPPPLPVALLADFYAAMDGDNWHRNDGWLDPEVEVCDWYGITCVTEQPETGGFKWIGHIHLADNNLRGELTAGLIERMGLGVATPSRELDLSGNAIAGPLPVLPISTPMLNLANNQISGPLPSPEPAPWTGPGAPPPLDLTHLDLSGNDFIGAVPESWAGQLELRYLDLSDNRLDEGHANAFAAMSKTDWGSLNLAGNEFSGELGTEIFRAKLYKRGGTNGFNHGLNLCFNDFSIANPDVGPWVADRHVGGPDYDQCLGRERMAIDASVSGSWYQPERAGEGISLMLLDNGAPLLYQFGFDTLGRQQWLLEVGSSGAQVLKVPGLLETRGDFDHGIAYDGDYPLMRPIAEFRLDRVGRDLLHLQRQYWDYSGCGPFRHANPNRPPPPGLCVQPLLSDRMDYQPLSRLAGSTCDNGSDFQHFSGAWYSPERTGEGFAVEILPDDRALVYWFTYKPDGTAEQAWMIGTGTLRWGDVTVPTTFLPLAPAVLEVDLIQPVGGAYGLDFDPDAIEYIDWGSLVLTLDEDSGLARWDSHLDAYGSGEHLLQRLARPLLAVCD